MHPTITAARQGRQRQGEFRIDGGVGRKQAYDPRSWGREAEAAMADRVAQACEQLGSGERSLLR